MTDLNQQNLKIIFILRNFAISGQVLTILVVNYILHIPLPLKTLSIVILSLIAFNIFTYFRKQIVEISKNELTVQIIFDIFILALLFFYTGGASNPFIHLFILPLLLALFILPTMYCMAILCLSAGLYVFLSFYNQALPHFLAYHLGGFFSLHIQGMFISYLVISFTMAVFVLRIRRNIKQNEEDIEYLVNQSIINKNLERVALIAASYSHKINTPLNTISLLADLALQNLDKAEIDKGSLREDLESISSATVQSSMVLQSLLKSFSQNSEMQDPAMRANEFLAEFKDLWITNKSDANLKIDSHLGEEVEIKSCRLIQEILTCVVDNAYDADADNITIRLCERDNYLEFVISDNGSGMDEKIAEKLGDAFNSSKGEGKGMGVFIAKKIVTKLGGEITLEQTSRQGSIVKFTINTLLA